MGVYIRKSVKAGPLRFNLSKSGVGVSAGVPGLRIGSGPRGSYLSAGRRGVYYRTALGKGRRRPAHGGRLMKLIGVLILLGVVIRFFWWIVGALALVALVYAAHRAIQANRARRSAVAPYAGAVPAAPPARPLKGQIVPFGTRFKAAARGAHEGFTGSRFDTPERRVGNMEPIEEQSWLTPRPNEAHRVRRPNV